MSGYIQTCWRCLDPLRPGEPPTYESTPTGEVRAAHPECAQRIAPEDQKLLDEAIDAIAAYRRAAGADQKPESVTTTVVKFKRYCGADRGR